MSSSVDAPPSDLLGADLPGTEQAGASALTTESAGAAAAAPATTLAAVGARGVPRVWFAGALAFAVGAILIGLSLGPDPINVWAIARGGLSQLPLLSIHSPLTQVQGAIIWQIRAPRVALGGLVGMMLAVAGASYQGTFHNPLADPYLLGVSQGAGLGATLVIVLLPHAAGGELLPLAAFVGGLVAVGAAFALGGSVGRGGGTGSLILAGVTVAAFLSAIQTFLQQRQAQTVQQVYAWMLGGFASASWHSVELTLPWIAVSLVVLVAHRRVLDVLSVGDEEATALGLNVRRARALIVLAATVGTSAAVAVSGLIGFVGIIVPHVIRLLVSSSYRAIMPLALLIGAGFLILADVLARMLLSPSEVPIGVVTAFAGAPFFAIVLRRSRWVGM
jgi:iron complex transport system permease protein